MRPYYHKHYNDYLNDVQQPACLRAFLTRAIKAVETSGFDQEGGRGVESRLTAYYQGQPLYGITAGMLVLITICYKAHFWPVSLSV